MILLVYVFIYVKCSLCTSEHDVPEIHDDSINLFSGLEPVLKYFRSNPEPLARKILATFEKTCFYMTEPTIPRDDDPSRRPLISIEGHRQSRDSVGMALARLIDGRYLTNPAPCLVRYLQQLIPGSMLRRAYYILSLYATDFNAKVHLSTGRTVIINGGWMDQMTFTLLQTYREGTLPEVTNEVYKWPADLLRPDLSVFLTLPLARSPQSVWHRRALELYRSLQTKYPITVQNNKITMEELHPVIVQHIGHARDVTIKDSNRDEMEYVPNLFSGLQRILSYLRNSTNPTAHKMVDTFEKECHFKSSPEIPQGKLRKPFIVIEGNGQSSRDIVGKALARKMNARYIVHPATCLIRFLDIMPKGTIIRRAYYALSLYAMSFYIRAHLSTNKAVVLNGYWLDQVSFSLIQSYTVGQRLAPEVEQLFQMPEELIRPDLIFYLHLSDEMRHRQAEASKSPSWYTRALEMYESWQSTYPIVFEYLTGDDAATTESIYQYIQETLSPIRNVVQQDYGEETQVMDLFGGLEEVLKFFRNNTSVIARDILNTYEMQCEKNQDPVAGLRKPFIVVEGNNRTSRGVVTGRLSRAMQGLSLRQPPPCLRGFVHVLPRSSLLRRAFFILSLYVTSADIRRHLPDTPVFLNGYWLDQLTFAMIQTYPYGQLPLIESEAFKWPAGLLRPDLTIYLNYPDDLQEKSPLNRSPRNWKPRSLELYHRLQQLYNIQIYNMTAEYWKTSDEIYHYINYNLYAS